MPRNLTRYDLVKGKDGWELKSNNGVVGQFENKATAVKPGEGVQRILDHLSGGEGTVRIHTEIGSLNEERTYPRSKNSRKSLG